MTNITLAEDVLKNRKIKIGVLLLLDFSLIIFSYFLSYIFRFYLEDMSFLEVMTYFKGNFSKIILAAAIYIIALAICKQYNSIWSLAGVSELSKGIIAITTAYLINIIASLVLTNRIPMMVTTLSAIFIMAFCNVLRLGCRILRRAVIFGTAIKNKDFKKVLVIGAGTAGALVVRELDRRLELEKKVVGLIDDDKQKLGTYIDGVRVLGNRHDIKKIVKEKDVEEIIIAIANLEKKILKELINEYKDLKVKVKIMPGLNEIIDGKFSVESIRDVDVNDLLGRETVKLDYSGIADYLQEKIVLVTGGGGSIGSELCRQIVRFNPKQLIIFDIYENNAYEIQMELKRNYPELNLVTLIGSVRDKVRLEHVFNKYRPNVVFHAAAHKHVPLMEDSPCEAIKNNVMGTLNVAEVASKYKVERFVLISTDKAVNPTNVMGASKRLCEMIIQAINKESNTDFVAVRFGNVLGSNGSVVPLFKKQIAKGGPVTLTHKEITRFFMTIPEAAQLVLQAGVYAKGGEIFVLDMGEPVKIYDLAENLIKLSGFEPNKDIKIEVTGLRPGEKLYEELLMDEEGLKNTAHEKIFIGKPGTFDLTKLKQSISKLMNISTDDDMGQLRNTLKHIVPTYKESAENKEVLNDISKKEIAVTTVLRE